MEYLTASNILNKLAVLSKSWYRLSRDNSFWKKRFLREFPEELGRASADLSQDWLQWYRNTLESILSHRLSPSAFAIDYSSSTIKTHRSAWHHPPLRDSAFYDTESVYYHHSHSARVRQSGFRGARYETQREIVDNDEKSPYEYGLESNGAINAKGMEWLMHCNAWSGQIMLTPSERNFVFVVKDDWEDEQIREILAGKALSSHLCWARPRFVQYSVAVAKHYALPSCVVLHAGYRNHFISVVQNFRVLLHQKLLSVTPKRHARVALLVHQVLMGFDMVLPSAVDAENNASAAISALRAGNEVQILFADKLKEILESHMAANPNNYEIMRDIVGYNVIVTGDHLSSIKWDKYPQDVEKSLHAHSSRWKVHTKKLAEEAVRGAASLGFYSPNTFTYGGALPLTPLEPRDVDDNDYFQS